MRTREEVEADLECLRLEHVEETKEWKQRCALETAEAKWWLDEALKERTARREIGQELQDSYMRCRELSAKLYQCGQFVMNQGQGLFNRLESV